MDSQSDFECKVTAWAAHLEKNAFHSSIPLLTTDCPEYRQIVAMGESALPLIRALYDRDSSGNEGLAGVQSHLVDAVHAIVGERFSIPEEIRGRVDAMRIYTKQWLDDHLKDR